MVDARQPLAAKNIGKLNWQEISGAGITTYRETYTYDSLGRPSQIEYKEGAANFYYVNQTYSSTTGLPQTVTYPVSTSNYRLKLQYDYHYGQLYQITQPDTAQRYWLANASDARGNVIDETLGNPGDAPSLFQTVSGYDQVTGLLDYRQTGPSGGTATQNLTYEWNKVGSLTMRQDNNQSLTERIYYDNVHRLDYSTLNGTTNLDLAYDARGNITSKTGVGTYTYSPTRLHAVASITNGSTTTNYTYDSNGNMLSRGTGTATWYANNLAKKLTFNSSNWSSFEYTPYGQRWQQTYVVNGNSEATVYIGKIFEKVTTATVTIYKHYVYVGDRVVLFYIRNSAGANTRYTVNQDHLGSTDAFYNVDGTLKVKESFDAFGSRRGTNWTGTPTVAEMSSIAVLTRRGFTQHETLDSNGLIHMNGRVYDPVIGRFLSADPFIPNPLSTQDFNRYSYLDNNPLSFTDPSGFSPCGRGGVKCMPEDTFDVRGDGGGGGGGVPYFGERQYFGSIEQDWGAWLESLMEKTRLHFGRRSSRQSQYANRLPPTTTPAYDVPLQEPQGNSFRGLAGQLWNGIVDTIAQIGINQQAPDGFPIYTLLGSSEMAPAGSPAQTPEEQLARDLGPAAFVIGSVITGKLSGALATETPLVLRNRAAGNAFRDDIANLLRQAGRDVQTEVVKKTPFGVRTIDIEVNHNGRVLGGVETKAGGSRYLPSQRAKDEWLRQQGYPVDLVREPQ